MTEQEQIKEAFEDLLKSLRKETSKENRQKIKEAFEFANEAHKGVKRRSGEPYILHPLAVAKIAVKEIGLGTTSVISALLHEWWKIPIIQLKISLIYSGRKWLL